MSDGAVKLKKLSGINTFSDLASTTGGSSPLRFKQLLKEDE
jgi:hypothetical protein